MQRLRADHAAAVLDFELANRAYFAESISDRGDEYYRDFARRHAALLAEQERGGCAFYVLVEEGGEIVGRFNLYDLAHGAAVLGYRVAQRVASRGVATSALRDLCRIARDDHGLRTLRAATSTANVASRHVLEKAGFVHTGAAAPSELGGREGAWYELALGR